MTQDQTRQLGIEFERRLKEIYPNFEYSEKLSTDTIYSILSEFCIQFINNVILQSDTVEENTIGVSKSNDILKTLIKHKVLLSSSTNNDFDKYNKIFKKPDDYYMYIRSASIAGKTYKNDSGKNVLQNTIVRQKDIQNQITFTNEGCIIRQPLVVLESTHDNVPYIKVIHDKYTNIIQLELVYYCQPYRFNIINFNDDDLSEGATHSYCQLPYSLFDDIVEGAVNLYVSQYKFKLLGNSNSSKKQKQEDGQ